MTGVGETGGEQTSPDGADERRSEFGTKSGVDRRRFLGATAASAAAAGLAGCQDALGLDDGDAETFTVVVLAGDPESGLAASSIVDGAKLAAGELNQGTVQGASTDVEGGVLGERVDVIVADGYDSPSSARDRYRALVDEHDVDLTVGVLRADVLHELLDEIAAAETPHVTTGSTDSAVSYRVFKEYESYKYHFRTAYTEFQVQAGHFGFLQERSVDLGWGSLAAFATDSTGDNRDVHELFGWQLDNDESGPDVVYDESHPAVTDDFSSVFEDIERAGADVAYVAMGEASEAAIDQWADRGRPFDLVTLPLSLGDPQSFDPVDPRREYAVGGTVATATSRITEYTRPFVNAYRDEYGRVPAHTGYTTYAAVMAGAEAAAEAGTAEGDAVVDSMEQITFEGPFGRISFTEPSRHVAHDLVMGNDGAMPVVFQWQERDGDLDREVIWPDEHATATYQTP